MTVSIGGTSGLLLVRLMHELGTEDGGGVISRALGLLDLALAADREGKEVCFVDPKTRDAERGGDMSQRIEQDHRRFREIVRGKIKQNLRKYISAGRDARQEGEGDGHHPAARRSTSRTSGSAHKQQGGVGQGEGEPGDSLGQGEEQPGEGKAGDSEGQHTLEVDVSLEELAEILGEELELPRIEPKGKENDRRARRTATPASDSTGPESLRHFKRTFKQALRRQIAIGTYNPENPIIIPIREDKRYRTWKHGPVPQNNAVIIYMMDVSGSMGDEQKEIVRIESFWIDTWLRIAVQGPRDALHHPRRDGAARSIARPSSAPASRAAR